MVAVAWTAIGLLAAAVFGMYGMMISLGGRIDDLGAGVNARIDDLGASLNARIDGLAARLDSHVERHAG